MAQTVPNKTHTHIEAKVLNLFYISWRFSFYTEKRNTKVKKSGWPPYRHLGLIYAPKFPRKKIRIKKPWSSVFAIMQGPLRFSYVAHVEDFSRENILKKVCDDKEHWMFRSCSCCCCQPCVSCRLVTATALLASLWFMRAAGVLELAGQEAGVRERERKYQKYRTREKSTKDGIKNALLAYRRLPKKWTW